MSNDVASVATEWGEWEKDVLRAAGLPTDKAVDEMALASCYEAFTDATLKEVRAGRGPMVMNQPPVEDKYGNLIYERLP